VTLGHVAANTENADQVPSAVMNGGLGGLQQLAMAVTGKGHPFLILTGTIVEQCGEVVGPEKLGQFRGDEIKVGFSPNACLVGAEKLLKALVAADVDPIGVFQPDEIRHGVEQCAQMAAFCFECG